MNAEEAARLLRVSRDTVARAVTGRGLGAIRAGTRLEITTAALADYLTNTAVATPGKDREPVDVTDLPKLMTLEEVAAGTNLPLTWLRRGCRAGELAHLRPDKKVLMAPAHVFAAVEAASRPAKATTALDEERRRRAGRRRPHPARNAAA